MTTRAIRPRVSAYAAQPMVLMIGCRTALTTPKMIAIENSVTNQGALRVSSVSAIRASRPNTELIACSEKISVAMRRSTAM